MKLDGVTQRRSLLQRRDCLQAVAALPVLLASCSVRLPAVALEPPPAAVEPPPSAVQDRQGYLEPAAEQRLERILAKLEADTGYKLRVLTQSKSTAPELGPLLQDRRRRRRGQCRVQRRSGRRASSHPSGGRRPRLRHQSATRAPNMQWNYYRTQVRPPTQSRVFRLGNAI